VGDKSGKMEDLVKLNKKIDQHYTNKKVFVTGHTGFKGSWFITWLHLIGAKIKGYALAADDKSLFNIICSHINFENSIADIRDRKKLQTELQNFQPDFVFHFAAQPLVRRSYEIPAETFDVNITGTANLLEGIKNLNKKCTVIVITTDKVYKNQESNHHYVETDTLGGHDPYSASKACVEIVASAFRSSYFNIDKHDAHQKALATVRAGNVIGGGDYNRDRIVPDIIRSLSAGEPVNVRNQNAVRPWQHVLESLSGYLSLGALLQKNPDQFSGAYNFGPDAKDHLSVKELVETAISCWGNGTWIDASNNTEPHEAGLLQLDITKAKDELNWKPKLNSKQAIQWAIDWYKQPEEKKFDYTLEQIKSYYQDDI
jgi:CDP-glucose 4,6-dehydratase